LNYQKLKKNKPKTNQKMAEKIAKVIESMQQLMNQWEKPLPEIQRVFEIMSDMDREDYEGIDKNA